MENDSPSAPLLITRGNLDGIACAAVFLHRYPAAEIAFVTSPPAALRALRSGTGEIWLADIALTKEIAAEMRTRVGQVFLADHHPAEEMAEGAFVDPGQSAAGVLREMIGSPGPLDALVAIADLHERSETEVLERVAGQWGQERLEREAIILDLSWRSNIEDDQFRLDAAKALSLGTWPSEVQVVRQHYEAVKRGDRWIKALDKVRREIVALGPLAVLDLRGKRLSMHGFGSMAVVEVAREMACRCAAVIHGAGEDAIISLRAVDGNNLDLGSFVQKFARERGHDGGGHRGSAGARISIGSADRLIKELADLASPDHSSVSTCASGEPGATLL